MTRMPPNQPGPLSAGLRHQVVKALTVDGTPNTEYILGQPWLLPEASRPDLMQGAVNSLLAVLEYEADQRKAVRSRSQVGFMLICLGRRDEALKALHECARTQESNQDYRGLMATQLRLLQAFQASNDVAAAIEIGHTTLSRCIAEPALSDLQHFAHHHLGKAMLQAGLYGNARQHLLIALVSRQQMSDQELVSSTQAALSLLRRLETKHDA